MATEEPRRSPGSTAIHDVLGKRGWTMREFARALGVNPSTITKWANGKLKPSRDHITLMHDVLGIPVTVWH